MMDENQAIKVWDMGLHEFNVMVSITDYFQKSEHQT